MNDSGLIKIFISSLLLFFMIISCNIDQKGTDISDKEIKELTKSSLTTLCEHTSKFAFVKANEDYYSSSNAKSCYGDIYVYDLVDSSLYEITDNCYYETDLCWSRDGKKLLFATNKDTKYEYDEPDMNSNRNLYIYDFTDNTTKKIANFSSNAFRLTFFTGMCWTDEGIIIGDDKRILLIDENGSFLEDILYVKDSLIINSFAITTDQKNLFLCYSFPNDLIQLHVGFMNVNSNHLNKINGNYTIIGTGLNENSFLFGNRDSLFICNIESLRYKPVDLSGFSDTLTIVSACYLDSTKLLFNSVRSWFVNGKINRKIKLTGYVGVYNLQSKTVDFLTTDSRHKSDLALYNKIIE